MSTGDRIKSLRLEKGFSQEALGKLIGVQKAAINKYELNTVVNLKRSKIAALAIALDTSPAYLMGYTDEKEPDAASESGYSALDHELADMLSALSPMEYARVKDFIAGLIAARDN